MSFENILLNGRAKRIFPNKSRALSLVESSNQAIKTAKNIPLNLISSKTILRELYEGLRQYCEAIGYIRGYKFLDHESITYFLRDILNEISLSIKFDRYRKLRNGITYYGNAISLETIQNSLIEIPQLISQLEKHFKS